jgi:hypothetical protein
LTCLMEAASAVAEMPRQSFGVSLPSAGIRANVEAARAVRSGNDAARPEAPTDFRMSLRLKTARMLAPFLSGRGRTRDPPVDCSA